MGPGGSHLGIETCCLKWWMSVCERLSDSESGLEGRSGERLRDRVGGWSRMGDGVSEETELHEVSKWR